MDESPKVWVAEVNACPVVNDVASPNVLEPTKFIAPAVNSCEPVKEDAMKVDEAPKVWVAENACAVVNDVASPNVLEPTKFIVPSVNSCELVNEEETKVDDLPNT